MTSYECNCVDGEPVCEPGVIATGYRWLRGLDRLDEHIVDATADKAFTVTWTPQLDADGTLRDQRWEITVAGAPVPAHVPASAPHPEMYVAGLILDAVKESTRTR